MHGVSIKSKAIALESDEFYFFADPFTQKEVLVITCEKIVFDAI